MKNKEVRKMSRKQKIYCKIGQVLVEGSVCALIGITFALMILSKI